jgi:hypothetical protein
MNMKHVIAKEFLDGYAVFSYENKRVLNFWMFYSESDIEESSIEHALLMLKTWDNFTEAELATAKEVIEKYLKKHPPKPKRYKRHFKIKTYNNEYVILIFVNKYAFKNDVECGTYQFYADDYSEYTIESALSQMKKHNNIDKKEQKRAEKMMRRFMKRKP